MKIRPTLLFAACFGAGVPLIVIFTSSILWQAGVRFSPHVNSYAFLLKVMIWPSSYPFLALSEGAPWNSIAYVTLLFFAIVANILLYSALAFLYWLGVNKFRPLSYLTGLLILAYWIAVLKA